MLIVDSPWLPGSQPAVLAATLLFNKFYLSYILPCVWKFFFNPRSGHDSDEKYIIGYQELWCNESLNTKGYF